MERIGSLSIGALRCRSFPQSITLASSRKRMMSEPLWTPSEDQMAATHMRSFMRMASRRSGRDLTRYDDLHAWSVGENADYWDAVWDYAGVVAETKGETVIADADKVPGAKYFPEARLNYAENLLRRTGGASFRARRGTRGRGGGR